MTPDRRKTLWPSCRAQLTLPIRIAAACWNPPQAAFFSPAAAPIIGPRGSSLMFAAGRMQELARRQPARSPIQDDSHFQFDGRHGSWLKPHCSHQPGRPVQGGVRRSSQPGCRPGLTCQRFLVQRAAPTHGIQPKPHRTTFAGRRFPACRLADMASNSRS